MLNIKLFEEFDVNEKKDQSEVTSKDTMRVNDIISKSGGDWCSKAIQLTRQQATAITDAHKAYRRGLAAELENYKEMARIFFMRAGELGFHG